MDVSVAVRTGRLPRRTSQVYPIPGMLGTVNGDNGWTDRKLSILLAVVMFLVYNVNGREIGSYDSQPTKFLARELVLRHTFALDRVVAEFPPLAERSGFARGIDGHYYSAYPVTPAVFAAALAWPLTEVGLLDWRWPLTPNLVAKFAASLLTAITVALAFLVARRRTSRSRALLIALGLGLGTNLWALASQTLWQHESAIFGLMVALHGLARPSASLKDRHLWLASTGLAVAGAARPQCAPAILVLAASIPLRRPRGGGVVALTPILATGSALFLLNVFWFGGPLGAMPHLEALHPSVHLVQGTFDVRIWRAALGLLVSPSRGLLVFSPVVVVAALGIPAVWREAGSTEIIWTTAAAAAQFVLYAVYAVWWGGYTYGPRYCLDLLPLLVPLASIGLPVVVRASTSRVLVLAAFAWSVILAGTGAFCYPHDQWNNSPVSVDRNHSRLWDWSDPQFIRCWKAGLSPANFDFFRGP